MPELDRIAWEVLNATADDCENLEEIAGQIADASVPARLSEIADQIRHLVTTGLLTVVMDDNGNPWKDPNDLSYVWRGWFRMTPTGRQAWQASQHFADIAQENA
jgi:hypothetical protein